LVIFNLETSDDAHKNLPRVIDFELSSDDTLHIINGGGIIVAGRCDPLECANGSMSMPVTASRPWMERHPWLHSTDRTHNA
jgi:hypothetical protein